MKYLKRVRVAISLIVFALTSFLFLDFTGLVPPQWFNGVTFLQFIPSLLKFAGAAGLATAGFLVVLLLTLLFGRVYCSSICPLGTLQDFFTFLSRKTNRKRYLKKTPRYDLPRYALLGVTAIALVAGSTLAANILDPFSNAGRILTNLVRPLLIGGNNIIAFTLENLHLYSLYPAEPYIPGWYAVLFAFLVLGIVGWLAFTRGRLYCNLLCPVGALLGLVSRVALFKIVIDEGDCKGCNLCERVCKGGCIDGKARTVDFDRCIACFNCINACPRGDMEFRLPWQKRREPRPMNDSRRRFVQQATGSLLIFAALPEGQKKAVVVKKPTTVPAGSALPVTPPGSRGLDHFTATCTACHLCVSACISRVLQPSFVEYGIGGLLQPRMDYRVAYCNFDCVLCGQVCPSGAIVPLLQEEKKLTQLGQAKFIKDNCVVNTEGTDCGACSEHCPTKAVRMVPFKDKLVIPEVHNEYCVGCGACEHACPTKPYKAIYVESNRTHQAAKKPEEKKIEQPAAPATEDFPF